MKGYIVYYYLGKTQLTQDDLLKLISKKPRTVDAIICKPSNGWSSPRITITLVLRKEKGQIENIGARGAESGILTIDSFKKGNVAKLLFNGKNFSPSIIKRIEKLLRPPEGSNAKIRQIIIQTDEGKWILNPRFVLNKK
jgi:hypothetical protein